MAQLIKSQITGSLTDTGSLIVSGSQPVQLPLLNSGSGEINPDLITNQFWFDTGDVKYKYSTIGSYTAGAWVAGPNLIAARRVMAGGGSQNDGFVAGGRGPAAPGPYMNSTEEISGGIAWTAGGNLNNARGYFDGTGCQNSGLVAGGSSPTAGTEEYDGSTWTTGGNLITGRNSNEAVFGTQNSAVYAGGQTPTVVACTEEYNGSSWSTGGVLSTARYELGSATGTQNAGLASGGSTPS